MLEAWEGGVSDLNMCLEHRIHGILFNVFPASLVISGISYLQLNMRISYYKK
jgi:hypothetical protein